MIWFLLGFIILLTHSWFIMHNRGEIMRLKSSLGLSDTPDPDTPVSELEKKLSKDRANLEGFHDGTMR